MNLVFLISPLIFSLFLCSLFIFLLFNLFRYFYLVFLIFLLFLTVSTCLGWPCLPPWLGGGVWERVRVAKWGQFLSELPKLRWDSGTRRRRRRRLPEASPKALLKPYFSRACPQDDVSSTRQTPSNEAKCGPFLSELL